MAAEKARYFLEQSIPELQEYEKKNIFSKDEIISIAKKRNDFEHRVNAAGCKSIEFLRYAQYEMNLDSLFRKRVKRLSIRSRMHYGSRRIFFVLDRATRRFPGDLSLWIQYIKYAKKEKASSVLVKAFASALKLHPTKSELWIYAAQHSVDVNLDIAEARGYMQRGLRFCNRNQDMWLEYAKLEMIFVAKIFIRRTVLGIDKKTDGDLKEDDDDDDENMIKLPETTGEELNERKIDKSLDTMALENVDTNPALNGALAIAIFDQAMIEFPEDIEFAVKFYELFSRFTQLKSFTKLLEHVVTYMLDIASQHPLSQWLRVKLPIEGLKATNYNFPSRLATSLSNMEKGLAETTDRAQLYLSFVSYFGKLLDTGNLDLAIRRVITSKISQYCKMAEKEAAASPQLYVQWVSFQKKRGKIAEASEISQRALRLFPKDKSLSVIRKDFEQNYQQLHLVQA